MKEITTEITLKLTFIDKVLDSNVDYFIESERSLESRRNYEKLVAEDLLADKADICGIKHFVMDIDHELFFDDSDLYERSTLFSSLVTEFLSKNPQVQTDLSNYIEERLKERCKE